MAKKTGKKVATKAAHKAKSDGIGIRPLGDRVVVRPLTEDEMGTKSPSGIIIPETVSKEKPEQGIVVAVGPGKYEDGTYVPLEVKENDRVVFSKFGYDEVKIGGTEYYVVGGANILAVIKN